MLFCFQHVLLFGQTTLHRYVDAEELYEQLITVAPTNPSLYKRQVAVLIAQTKYTEAIDKLNKFLEM